MNEMSWCGGVDASVRYEMAECDGGGLMGAVYTQALLDGMTVPQLTSRSHASRE